MTAAETLSPAARKALKARAHALEPVVWVGADGLTDAVIAEIDRALTARELIKVRGAGLARGARETTLAEICLRCAAQPVQHIGKVMVLYRKKPEPERPALSAPASRSRGPTRASRGKRAASRRRTG